MSSKNALFLIANFPYTVDISNQQGWCFVKMEMERDVPWLLAEEHRVVLSGLGKHWCGARRKAHIVTHAGMPSSGWMALDAVLAWMVHFVDAIKASCQGCVIGIAPSPEAGLGIALARLICKERVRLVVRVQGHTASRALFVHRSRWRFRLLEWIESFVLRRADLVVPMGRFTKELVIGKGVEPVRIVVLPFPVRWANSATVTPLSPQPCVLFVGRLEKEKGVQVLLEAMCQVREAIPSVRLLIAGDGSYRDELEARADRLGLPGHVSFLGWLDGVNLQRVYKEAWVLVLPSILEEGLGMVLVEAGLMGRPVIGSKLGGIQDIIQHGYNGLLVPQGNAEALAEAILSILTDRDLAQQMGLANLQVARRYLESRDKALEQVRQAILNLVEI